MTNSSNQVRLVFILFFCIFLFFKASAQDKNVYVVHGKLIDRSHDIPVEHALCLLKNNQFIGDVSDKFGNFSLKVPRNYIYDTIHISLMGYESLEIPAEELTFRQDTLILYLDRKSFLLDEVVVTDHGLNLQKIVIKAIKMIPKNFPNKKHQLTGFYRKLGTEGTRYTHLEEAVLTIDDFSYKSSTDRMKMRVDQYRQSEEFGDVDTIHIAYLNKLKEKWPHPANWLDNIYGTALRRRSDGYWSFFEVEKVNSLPEEHYEFELLDIAISEGDTILQIGFLNIPYSDIGRPIGYNKLKINMSNYAIVEYEYNFSNPDRDDYLYWKTHVKYQNIGGRYYPCYIQKIKGRDINKDRLDKEYDIKTLWVEDVKIKDFGKVTKEKSITKKFEWDSYWLIPYDSAFWQNYQLLKEHPLERGAKTDLEINEPLEHQFKRKSNEYTEAPSVHHK